MRNRKRKQKQGNDWKKIPLRRADVSWHEDEWGRAVVDVVNRGMLHRVAQHLFGKPKISHVHLDRVGSFVWRKMDGVHSLWELGEQLEAVFGERVSPTYERLTIFIRMMDGRGWIEWK